MYRAALALAEAQAEAARRGIKENEVRLEEAKLNYNRFAALLKEGIVTQADVDTAKAGVDSIAARIGALNQQTKVAERQIDLAQTDLDNTIIRAPFSGMAISKDAQPGEMVSPVSAGGGFTRTGICTMVDMRSLEIEVDVNESYISRVKPGQDVDRACSMRIRTGRFPRRSSRRCRRPIGRRRRCSCASRFKQLDPRILPDMGIKVTFLGQIARASATAGAPLCDHGRWRSCRRMRSSPRAARRYVFVVSRRRPSSAAPSRPVAADGDRLEVTRRTHARRARRAVAAAHAAPAQRSRQSHEPDARRRHRVPEEEPSMSLVKIRDVHKHFTRGNERIDVLQGVSLDVQAGRVPGVDGPLGVGQDDAAQSDGRPGQSDRRHDRDRRIAT